MVSGPRSVWVQVTGRLDRDTASLLEQTLQRGELRLGKVVLDLRELTFMDRAGVQVIVDASIEAWRGDIVENRRAAPVRAARLTAPAVRALEATGVGDARCSAVSTSCYGLGPLIGDRSNRGWHERGAGDHQAERDYPHGDPEGA